MPVKYPIGWSKLLYPNVRSELLEYLKAAASPNVPKDVGELEFIVHFFFDDHDFLPDASAWIGEALLSEDEARDVAAFVSALDVAIGPRQKPLDRVTDRDWMPVRTAADLAFRRLVTKGEPTFE